MNRVTLCLAYYENPGMLVRQLVAIEKLAPWVQEQIELIVVDDGSPVSPAADLFPARDFEPLCRQRLYRMAVDVPWNMDACRNLAASQAETDWLLLTDIDHLVPEKTWTKILTSSLNPGAAYKFARVTELEGRRDTEPYKPHPNTWLISRKLYDKAGGYDERLAGWYGTDGDFRNSVAAVAPTIQFKEPIIRVPREVTPDASTTTLVRRSPENTAGLDAAKRAREQIQNRRPLRNSFPWIRVL